MKKTLKILGYILLGLLVLLIVLGIILPKEASTSVSIDSKAPANYVYNILMDPSIQDWNAFLDDDPDTKLTPYGDKGPGSGYNWDSAKMGKGGMEINAAEKDKSVTFDIYLSEEKKDPMTTVYSLENGQIAADWSAKLGFPMNIAGPLFAYNVKKTLGKNLKRLEKLALDRQNGQYYNYNVLPLELDEAYYITSRGEVAPSAAQAFYTKSLSGLYRLLQERQIETVGPDCGLIYHNAGKEGSLDLAAALPVGEDITLDGASSIMLPRAQGVTVDYYGDRSAAQSAHKAIQDFLADRQLVASPPHVEQYVTDVLEEKDPSKWLTKIYYRIAE